MKSVLKLEVFLWHKRNKYRGIAITRLEKKYYNESIKINETLMKINREKKERRRLKDLIIHILRMLETYSI